MRLLVLTILAAFASATTRVLLIDDDGARQYTRYTHHLRQEGYEVTVESTQRAAELLRQQPLAYNNIITFATHVKNPPAELTAQSLVNLLRHGINILTATSTQDLSEQYRDFAREFELDFDDRSTSLIDHFNYDTNLDNHNHKHTTVIVNTLKESRQPFVSDETRKQGSPILYRGVAHEVSRHPLVTNVLYANPTSYSADASDKQALAGGQDDLFVSGQQAGLVSVFQLKNNARILFSGSKDLFGDELWDAQVSSSDGATFPKSGNEQFVRDLTRWTFRQTGQLKSSTLRHSRAKDGVTSKQYKVKDEIDVEIDISEWHQGRWQPFIASDVQLELTMLDPHLRVTLESNTTTSNSTIYKRRITLPDRHGVFTFKVDYKRQGYSFVTEQDVVSIVPPRHDEYDRFITGATPFYIGAMSVSVATLIFLFLFLGTGSN
ncbi:oligosaccharyl transferase glycoprotein complex, beta subunit [Microbotryomycetes sp. JL221]|nr:oligosaccharyl transferase glycoprotein complex, beta subunit [Microbotryomycetes sp. JL221]